MTAFNIIKSLTKRGNVVIGSGCYAAAIASSNPERVIKVGSSSNDPWLDYYYEIITKQQNNIAVPKVHSFYYDSANSYYVCIMERLAEHPEVTTAQIISDLCRDYTSHMIVREEFVAEANKYPTEIPDIEAIVSLLDSISDKTDSMGYMPRANTYDDCNEDFNGRRLDMHRGNFMYRDKVLVVTDPWCETNMDDVQNVSDWLESKTLC